jgi:hypothetical protein
MDEACYVGYSIGGQDIGLDPHGHSNAMTGPVGYWQVDDIRKSVKTLLDAGSQAQQKVKDGGWGQADRVGEGRRRQRHRPHAAGLRRIEAVTR